MVESRDWGSLPSGETVQLFTFGDGRGMEVDAASFGATLVSIRVPDRAGRIAPVLLGFDTLEGYLQPARPYFGATVGRYANRIAGSSFTIDGTAYALTPNEGANQLHGGPGGLDRVLWSATPLPEGEGVRFTYVSPAGDQGFPGALQIVADMAIGAPGEIILTYAATTDAPTHVNLTSHGYFNLSGRAARAVTDHRLAIAADHVLAIDEASIPLPGAPMPVAGTPFDLRRPTRVGDALAGVHEQLVIGNGFDHCFALSERDAATPAATLHDPKSGRLLEVFTTEPGIQLYTANGFDGSLADSEGRPFVRNQALALETQHFPNSPNRPDYPSTLLRPGETYRSETRLRFGLFG